MNGTLMSNLKPNIEIRYFFSFKATCVGNNWNAAVSMLKQEYKEEETSLKEALDLAIKVST